MEEAQLNVLIIIIAVFRVKFKNEFIQDPLSAPRLRL